jgi:hypothetical protein
MGATPTIYARSRDRWRAYTSNTSKPAPLSCYDDLPIL